MALRASQVSTLVDKPESGPAVKLLKGLKLVQKTEDLLRICNGDLSEFVDHWLQLAKFMMVNAEVRTIEMRTSQLCTPYALVGASGVSFVANGSSVEAQHRACEVPRMALAALLECFLIERYREQLLREQPGLTRIRHDIAAALSCLLPWAPFRPAAAETGVVKFWYCFADGIDSSVEPIFQDWSVKTLPPPSPLPSLPPPSPLPPSLPPPSLLSPSPHPPSPPPPSLPPISSPSPSPHLPSPPPPSLPPPSPPPSSPPPPSLPPPIPHSPSSPPIPHPPSPPLPTHLTNQSRNSDNLKENESGKGDDSGNSNKPSEPRNPAASRPTGIKPKPTSSENLEDDLLSMILSSPLLQCGMPRGEIYHRSYHAVQALFGVRYFFSTVDSICLL